MSDVEVVDALMSKARGHCRLLFFKFEDERQETLNVRRRDVVTVGTLNERLSLEIEDGDEASHREEQD